MKINSGLEEYAVERIRSITRLKKVVTQEKLYLREKQFQPLLRSLDEVEKQHKKIDGKVVEALDLLNEINGVLEELRYE